MENEVVRTVLLKNEEFLRRHLVLSPTVIKKLRENGIITEYTCQKLMIQKSEDQMKTLLFPLKMRGLRSLQRFIDVLRETNHRWIAEELLQTDIKSGLRKAVDMTKSLRYWLVQKDNSAKFDSVLNEPLYDPPPLPTSPPNAGGGFPKYLDRVNHTSRDIYAEVERARNQTLKLAGTGYTSHRFQKGEAVNRKGSISSRVPEKLRELDKSFETESINNRSYLSMLKEEELAIHALFRQNQQEQREIEQKGKALSEIKGRVKDIEEQFANLYRSPQKEKKYI